MWWSWVAIVDATSLVAEHLVVTVHGLSGFATDLGYVGRRLEAESDGRVVVLACTCNEGRTTDGLAAGGRRVADEVSRFEAPSLRTISFLGNSLGGLYARYALAHLFDGNLVAGLVPAAFVTTAAPHLGVTDATYAPLLAPLAPLLAPIDAVSRSVRDVMRQTTVVRDMYDNRFLDPLRAFRARRAYAAVDGDFMVPFRSALFTETAGQTFFAEAKPTNTSLVRCLDIPSRGTGCGELAALDDLGWSKCAVSLPPDANPLLAALPLAHNKVVALERAGVKRLATPFERTDVGRPVMDDLARWIWHTASATLRDGGG
ncbi:hypothetical protein CTAYLR_000764 [Chrysophaeum taylorii]|uniref:DUF676 domain-containing protein n=1 Tax=Chrysophaeum taylorii TaxID=2483200 RepID=A0AAD7XNS4_9STRA|nr:hypothetical protein CTAYLR_000764 [Chrysophaeum taylorii]